MADDALSASLMAVDISAQESKSPLASVFDLILSVLSPSQYTRCQILALAMAQHPRLGAASPAAKLSPDCYARILEIMRHLRPIVLISGSDKCRAGAAGDDAPCVVFPSVVGTSKIPPVMGPPTGAPAQEYVVGDAALANRATLRLRHPIEMGEVASYEGVEALWRHAFVELHGSQSLQRLQALATTKRPVLIAAAPLALTSQREKLATLMFETFHAPAMCLCSSAALALYASGRTTGLVVDVGHTVTWCVPIVDGRVLRDASLRLDIGGNDMTDYLLKLLNSERGASLQTSAEKEMVRAAKEQCAHVVIDFDAALRAAEQAEELLHYPLPDGRVLRIGKERFRCAEVLFDPSLLGWSAPSLDDMAYNAVMKVEQPLRQRLYANIVLAGGASALPGLAERLTKELAKHAPTGTAVEASRALSARHEDACWRGGSLLASLPASEGLWVTAEEYAERGPEVLHRYW